MKKNPVSAIALICAFGALAVALWTGSRVSRLQTLVAQLQLQNETLLLELQALQTESVIAQSPDQVGSCQLLIDDWSYENSILTVRSGYVQISEAAAEPDVAVSLRRDGNLLHRVGIEPVPGEGAGCYEAPVQNVSFDAQPQEGDCLELWLEVTAGTTESVCVAEWYLENGELQLIAG